MNERSGRGAGVSAVFTAIAAGAAWWTVRYASAQSETAREAFLAETQPLLTDVPRGRERRPTWWDESGQPGGWEDLGEISVGSMGGPDLIASVSVPVRSVGNGAARIQQVTFSVRGLEAPGDVSNP